MVREAHGFFTDDGSFYERKEEAELHDTEAAIIDYLKNAGIQPEPILELLNEMRTEIEDYYDKAKAERETRAPSNPESGREDDHSSTKSDRVESDTSDNGSSEARVESVQQQPGARRKSVSNVGRRKRPKTIQDKRKEHGT